MTRAGVTSPYLAISHLLWPKVWDADGSLAP